MHSSWYTWPHRSWTSANPSSYPERQKEQCGSSSSSTRRCGANAVKREPVKKSVFLSIRKRERARELLCKQNARLSLVCKFRMNMHHCSCCGKAGNRGTTLLTDVFAPSPSRSNSKQPFIYHAVVSPFYFQYICI
jgi:hypothetical protein